MHCELQLCFPPLNMLGVMSAVTRSSVSFFKYLIIGEIISFWSHHSFHSFLFMSDHQLSIIAVSSFPAGSQEPWSEPLRSCGPLFIQILYFIIILTQDTIFISWSDKIVWRSLSLDRVIKLLSSRWNMLFSDSLSLWSTFETDSKWFLSHWCVSVFSSPDNLF